LCELKRHAEAVPDYDDALRRAPDMPFLFGTRLHTRMQIADWRDVGAEIAALTTRIQRKEKAAGSTAVLALVDAPEIHRKAARVWAQDKAVPAGTVTPLPKRRRHDKIRLGYFSMDFREHPVSSLVAGLIEAHDRSRFHVTGFSYGLNVQDETRKRLEVAFDDFLDVGTASDAEIVEIARARGIDIAVDLAGHTGAARTEIMARRAAPVQVNYLGYPGTMGADYMDYIVADGVLIPESSRRYYTEKVVTLPDSYQANDPQRRIADKTFTRAELALPETGFVFCCFNNTYKILPAVFESWMRILKRVPDSVLWLFEDCPGAAENLRKEAARRGVEPERLIFATRMARPEHLARHRAADLFLDTLPYNAHTTASDALWAGLPVLTHVGASFAGRVGASLLTAAGLPELVTTSSQAYEDLAAALATQPGKLPDIRDKLARTRLACPLFDLPRFTRHIEAAYAAMYERYQADLPPDHITIRA
jgi:predicted O-linked N-acetylglucosamine transferase (SPINDLY family)